MKIASIQLNIRWEDAEENLRRAALFIEKAKKNDCDVVVFPEMFNSGFSMNATNIAEPMDGKTIQRLCSLARDHQINIIAGLTEKEQHSLAKNTAVFINRKGFIKSKYIKNYPFTYADEHLHYESGVNVSLFSIDQVKACTFICYDLRFPELFRKVAKEVSLIYVIASWPEARQQHWQTLLKARAIENQCFIIGVNRIGTDGNGLNYIGGSAVYDPYGHELSFADQNVEYFETTIDVSQVKSIRSQLPFLNDMKAFY